MNANRVIAWLTGILTLLLATFSFVLSFNALTDLAQEHGVSIPPLFPLTVEAGVVIFSLNALYRGLHGEPAKVQWGLIIGSSLLAGVFNVLHADVDIVSRIMAAMPSLFLLLSFETFVGQVKHAVKRSTIVQSIGQLTQELNIKRQEFNQLITQKETEIEAKCQEFDKLVSVKLQELDRLDAGIEQHRTTLEQLKVDIQRAKSVQSGSTGHARQFPGGQAPVTIEQRRTQLVGILDAEGDIGAVALAAQLNTSRGTVYNDLKALEQEGVISKNGAGWEVVR